MYTKHRKIFTSIKTSKYCTDKNSQDIERKKKNPQTIKRKSHSSSKPKYAHSNKLIHMHSPANTHHLHHSHSHTQTITFHSSSTSPPPAYTEKNYKKKTHKIAKHINREICMKGSQS